MPGWPTPTSQGGELRSETFSAKVKAFAEHVAKAPAGGYKVRNPIRADRMP